MSLVSRDRYQVQSVNAVTHVVSTVLLDAEDDMCEAVREAGQRNAKKVNKSSTAKKADRKNKR